MEPLYRASHRGEGYPRVANVFWCEDDSVLARGRADPKFLYGPGRRPAQAAKGAVAPTARRGRRATRG